MAEAEVARRPVPSGRMAALQPAVVLIAAGLLALDLVLVTARVVDAPFRWWFPDTLLLIGALVGWFVVLGGGVDALLLGVGLVRAARARRADPGAEPPPRLGPWRRYGFFSLGAWPLVLPAIAAYFVVATSNVTQISLTLVARTMDWRDPILWRLEGGLHEWVSGLDVPVAAWDLLYHNAWTIEATALFALVLVSRQRDTVVAFLLSFVVLFYVGRLLGLLNPVLGPAFYRPELYGYLEGSLTADIQALLTRLIELGAGATWRSGILMGGISAMPSLHVGLVTTCAYWLAVARPALLAFGVPWVTLVWVSTVALGWHYALDGLGGILTAWLCIGLTRVAMRRSGLVVPPRLRDRLRARVSPTPRPIPVSG